MGVDIAIAKTYAHITSSILKVRLVVNLLFTLDFSTRVKPVKAEMKGIIEECEQR